MHTHKGVPIQTWCSTHQTAPNHNPGICMDGKKGRPYRSAGLDSIGLGSRQNPKHSVHVWRSEKAPSA